MEADFLRTELQNIRNHLTTLSRNIDNSLLTYNEMTRMRTRAATRRNLNNLLGELRNLYPNSTDTNTTPIPREPPSFNTTGNLNNNTTINPLNENLTPRVNYSRYTYPSLFNQPDMIEITLNHNGERLVNNLEDVQVYPSLRTLRESSTIHSYGNLETDQETCSICRESFEQTSIVRKLACGHIFHIGCVDEWFETNIRCPLCRQDLRDNQNIQDENDEQE